eukprot:GHVT01080851.1.p1 GENE.GHVT01080851.1~~GHVT01080851.1.p1  ORF type:complete len:472 (-),score=53.25 GHVT01080851.1:10449-11864(-)
MTKFNCARLRLRGISDGQKNYGATHAAKAAIGLVFMFFATIAIPFASGSEAALPSGQPNTTLDSSGLAQLSLLQVDGSPQLPTLPGAPAAPHIPIVINHPSEQKGVPATPLLVGANSIENTDVELQDSATTSSTQSVGEQGLTVKDVEKQIEPLANSEELQHGLIASTSSNISPDAVESADHGPPHPKLHGDSPAAIVENVVTPKKTCPIVFARKCPIATPDSPPGFSANHKPKYIGVVRHADGIYLDWLRSIFKESQLTVWDRRGLTAKNAEAKKNRTLNKKDKTDAAITDSEKKIKAVENMKDTNNGSTEEKEAPDVDDEAHRKAKLFRARLGKGWTCANGPWMVPAVVSDTHHKKFEVHLDFEESPIYVARAPLSDADTAEDFPMFASMSRATFSTLAVNWGSSNLPIYNLKPGKQGSLVCFEKGDKPLYISKKPVDALSESRTTAPLHHSPFLQVLHVWFFRITSTC